MLSKTLLCLLFLTFATHSLAKTAHYEINKMSELASILEQVRLEGHQIKKTLIVFDIDNTLLAMDRYLGSDQWFTWKSNLIKKRDPSLFSDLLAWQNILFNQTAMHPVESYLPKLVQSLQARQFPVFALTSRSPINREATQRELTRNKFNMKRTSIGRDIAGKWKPSGQKRLASYENGVFMTSGMHKGEMLISIIRSFSKGSIPFSQVIFLDDHLRNTTRVFESMKAQGVEILSLRYTKEDENVKKFHSSNGMKSYMTKQLKYLRATLLSIFKRAPRMI